MFVYGTLKRGCGNHRLMEGAEPLGEAEARGYTLVVDLLPYAVRAPEGCRVEGELYAVSRRQLEAVDELELSAGYVRVRARVEVGGGRAVEAWIYAAPGLRVGRCLASRYRCL